LKQFFIISPSCCFTSGCDWVFEGVCPERAYFVYECGEDADVTLEMFNAQPSLLEGWKNIDDADENVMALMLWLFNYLVYYVDDNTVQRNEEAIYFVKDVERLLHPWLVCVRVFDVHRQEDLKIFFKVNDLLPVP